MPAELAQKLAKLLPKIGNVVADDVPVSDDEDKDNKVVSTFGPTPTGSQYMHHHEVRVSKTCTVGKSAIFVIIHDDFFFFFTFIQAVFASHYEGQSRLLFFRMGIECMCVSRKTFST